MEVKASVSSNLRWDVHLEFNDRVENQQIFYKLVQIRKYCYQMAIKQQHANFSKDFKRLEFHHVKFYINTKAISDSNGSSTTVKSTEG